MITSYALRDLNQEGGCFRVDVSIVGLRFRVLFRLVDFVIYDDKDKTRAWQMRPLAPYLCSTSTLSKMQEIINAQ